MDVSYSSSELYTFDVHNPHGYLGLHEAKEGSVIRLFRPGASAIYLEVEGKIVAAEAKDLSGLFEYVSKTKLTPLSYRVYYQSGLLAHDPYAFWPTFGELDGYLLNKGVHYKLYEVLGAKVAQHQGVYGVKFAIWAPNAKSVALISDFNHWDGRVNPMRSMGSCGVWELFVPGIKEGEKYKFEIKTAENKLLIKTDPIGFYHEVRPLNASIVADPNRYEWKDKAWQEHKKQHTMASAPMLVYEMHLGSWKKKGDAFPNYREIAEEIARYVKEMGFTHIELLPIMEHPLDESWGYQVTGFYAVTSRFGSVQDFQYFVDVMHQNGIGVILDWVPAHFPTDAFFLKQFDGSFLYEHEDPRQGFHPHWNTLIFNYGRKEVSNFLIASALFWLDKMHIDGIRVDAVASMLYLDYGREAGEWIPNQYGGKENLDAIEFLKHLNATVHNLFPQALVIAEESTSFSGVTHSLLNGGLGFDFKWNMGWMNDTLTYFSKDALFRKYHHDHLTFGLLYAFSEKFMLVLSHDEVVHGKQSLISKMPGDDWQKFANLRLLYSYMICQPGKKLFFMGGEIGQWSEWNVKGSIEWDLLNYEPHRGMHTMVKELNNLYQKMPAFWEKDTHFEGFEWIDFHDVQNSIVAYLRKGSSTYLAIVHNFTPNCFENYLIRLHNVASVKEVFNTDAEPFFGSGKINSSITQIEEGGFTITLPPLATAIFEVTFV